MANAMRRAGIEMRDSLRRLLDELRDFVESKDDELVVRVMSRWISIRSKRGGRIFAEMRPSKDSVEVFVFPPPGELGSPSLVAKAPSSQGWGWFRSKFVLDGDGGDRCALRILRISYIHSLRRPSRRRGR